MAAAALPLAAALWPGHAYSQAAPAPRRTVPDAFVAESVPVDVTAGSVGDARERGLVQGRIAGFRRVLERIVAREDLAKVPQLNNDQIIEMVRDFSIANERSSAVRYLAELTVRFNPTAIRQLLRNAGVPFTETVSRPLVVVPVMTTGGAPALWGSVWHDTWIRAEPDGGLLPLIVPAAGAEESAQLTAAQAAAVESGPLLALAGRLDAVGALVVNATVEASGSVNMTIAEVRIDAEPVTFSVTHSGAPGQAAPEVLAGAVATAVSAAADNWRRRNRVTFGVKNQMTALVPVSDLKEWLSIRGRLSNVGLIDQIDVQAMTRDRVQITLHFAGAEEQLRLAMGQHDLSFTRENGVWVLENIAARKGSAKPAAPEGTP